MDKHGKGATEWTMVPVEPTAEMIEALAADVYPDDNNAGKALQGLRGVDVVFPKYEIESAVGKYNRMLAAAPVPPAGDVFVQRYAESCGEGGGVYAISTGDLCDYHHATRLTAERDGLLSKLETADKAYKVVSDTALQLFEDSQRLKSELTKARELIGKVASEGVSISRATIEEARQLIAHNVDQSCGQGAEAAKHQPHCLLLDPEEPEDRCTCTPCTHRFMSLADDPRRCADCNAVESPAAKCARCEASTVESCDEKGCGFLGAGNGAPEPTCNEQRSEIGLPTNAECVHCGRGRCFDR